MAAVIECYCVYIDFYDNIMKVALSLVGSFVQAVNRAGINVIRPPVLLKPCRQKGQKIKAKPVLYKIWSEINFNTYKKQCHNNQHRQFNLSDINTRLSGTGIDIKGVLNDKVRPREKCFKTV